MMRSYLAYLAAAGLVLGVSVSVLAQERPAAPPGGGSFGQGAAATSPFPDGPGKEIVSVACTQCHGPNVFTQLRMNEAGWRTFVYDMILRGAQVGPGDIDTAVKYMATAYGPGVPFPNQQTVQVSLADGDGKQFVEGTCGLCHGLDRAVAARRTAADWKTVIDRMVFYGAPLQGSQIDTTVAYLTKNYGVTETAAAK
jgi:cytochrome c5